MTAPEASSNQLILKDSASSYVPVLSVTWTVVALLVLSLIAIGIATANSGALIVGVIGLVLLGALGIWLIPRALNLLKWHPAELVIDAPHLELDATLQATYRRRPRKVTDVGTATISMTLQCEESATYRVGTDTRTETVKVVNTNFSGSGSGTPNGFEATIPIHIPANAGGPTIHLGNNKVVWKLHAKAQGPGKLPTQGLNFPITVVPSLAQRPIQDQVTYGQNTDPGHSPRQPIQDRPLNPGANQ